MIPSRRRKPLFVPNAKNVHWDRITDARVGTILKEATKSLIDVNDRIFALEHERDNIRRIIFAEFQTANASRMRQLKDDHRAVNRELYHWLYWRRRIEAQVVELARKRREIFGAESRH